MEKLHQIRGRGAAFNPTNRFDQIGFEPSEDADDLGYLEDFEDPEPLPKTTLVNDHTQTVFSRNDSPDVSFDVGINPYRGCEHGCAY